MKITILSDLHGEEPKLPGGDLLLLCGDYTASDKIIQWAKFFKWLKNQNYRKKILIAGNHDGFLEKAFPKNIEESNELKKVQSFLIEMGEEIEIDFEYLCNSGTEFEGLKIWGSPWSRWFSGVNPKCKYFMESESKLQSKFQMIPKDTYILMTHTPPYQILDDNRHGFPCGSTSLRQELDNRINPRFNFFGHIHEMGGKNVILKRPGFGTENNTHCYNVSYVDENYNPNNMVLNLDINL